MTGATRIVWISRPGPVRCGILPVPLTAIRKESGRTGDE